MLRTSTMLAALLLIGPPRPAHAQADYAGAPPALQEVFEGAFLVGAALNPDQFYEEDTLGAALVKKHFNAVTPENVMKWGLIHPEPDRYDFEAADRFVEFGEANGMLIVGHTLVWHYQTPPWVFEDEEGNALGREALLARMRDHIHAVVGRYEGRVDGWDVVNEALAEDGTMRRSPWLEIIGEDYVAKAFQFAHEADPEAALYYNDYALEDAPKREGALALLRSLQAQGLPVAGIGLQGHNTLDWPTLAQQDSTLAAFAELGLDVMITELDVDVLPPASAYGDLDVRQDTALWATLDPYPEALPDSVQRALARRYADLFGVYLRHRDAITRVTFWGVRDGDSWRNYWPVRGRTNYPLLFNREGEPKPAFHAVVRTATEQGG